MANVNKVILIGNLTRDPELRHTPNGVAVADLGLAVNRKFKDQEETVFVDITLWDKQAEVAAKYLQKGNPVYIEGRLQLDTWQDKTSGDNRSKLKVVGEKIEFLHSKAEGKPQGGGSSDPFGKDDGGDDKIPF